MNKKVLDAICFEDFSDMLDDIFEQIEGSEECRHATIVGKYEEVRQILNCAISEYCIEIGDISLCSEDCNGYKDEYALTFIDVEDLGMVVHCSPLKTKSGYLYYGADIVYILKNCNSAVQNYCETEAKFAIIGEEEYECRCCNCKDDNIYGFTVDNETYNGYMKLTYHSSTPVTEADIINMLKKLGY